MDGGQGIARRCGALCLTETNKITAIDHIVFRVKDVRSMFRFYEDVLGAHVEREVHLANI